MKGEVGEGENVSVTECDGAVGVEFDVFLLLLRSVLRPAHFSFFPCIMLI